MNDRDTLIEIAKLQRLGPPGPTPYKHTPKALLRPLDYPTSLEPEVHRAMRASRTWDQARAFVETFACQIAQTGFAGRRRASESERSWAQQAWAASQAHAKLTRVPGTCRGCNAAPCRCVV